MKIIEITGQIKLPITNEESDLLGKFEDHKLIEKQNLSEREQVLANGLVIKGVLSRNNIDGQIKYRKISTS